MIVTYRLVYRGAGDFRITGTDNSSYGPYQSYQAALDRLYVLIGEIVLAIGSAHVDG